MAELDIKVISPPKLDIKVIGAENDQSTPANNVVAEIGDGDHEGTDRVFNAYNELCKQYGPGEAPFCLALQAMTTSGDGEGPRHYSTVVRLVHNSQIAPLENGVDPHLAGAISQMTGFLNG